MAQHSFAHFLKSIGLVWWSFEDETRGYEKAFTIINVIKGVWRSEGVTLQTTKPFTPKNPQPLEPAF